jgi:hypothetical protein
MKPDLEVAIVALEALAALKGPLTRHDVRPVLVGIGSSLVEASAADIQASRMRFLALTQGFRDAWEAAVRDELAMACTEHIRSVDPRYLDHPGYDLAYTVEARRVLEARLKGAEVTGVVLDDALSAGIRRADSLLEGRKSNEPRGRT